MPVFRWIPEEEAWLEARIIADGGQSDTNNKHWIKNLVADFQNTFPFVPRRTLGGRMETQNELVARWKEIRRRVTKWIQNHQNAVLSKHSRGQPQTSAMRSSAARLKRPRSKNARDMAKANHPQLKTLWTELRARVKDGELTRSQMLVEHNNAVTKLLQDEQWNAYYSEMANRLDAEHVTYGEPNHSSTGTLQFISCEPQASEFTAPKNHNIPLVESSHAPSITDTLVNNPNHQSTSPRSTSSILEPSFPSSFTDTNMATVPGTASAHGASSTDPEFGFNSQIFAPTSNTSSGAHAPSNISMPLAHIHQNSYHIPEHVEPLPPHSAPSANPSSTPINPHPFPSSTQPTVDFNPRLIEDPVQRHRHTIIPIPDTPRSIGTATHSRTFKDWSPAGDWYRYKSSSTLSPLIDCTAFAPDGKSVVTGSDDGAVTVWDVRTCEKLLGPLKCHKGCISAVAISPDRRYIVSGSWDSACIWDAQTGAKLLKFTRHEGCINAVVFWPDSRRVISSDYLGGILMWDASSGNTIRSFAKSNHFVKFLDCSTDGRFLLAASGERVSIWNVASGELVPHISEELTDFYSAWNYYDKSFTYSDGRVRAWKVDSDNSELRLTPLYSSSISPDREYMAIPRNSRLGGFAIYSRRPHRNEQPNLTLVEEV